MTKSKQLLGEYLASCNNIATHFARHYFGKDTEEWWVASEVGGVYYINDRFFGMTDMVEYIKYHYSKDMMFEREDYCLTCHEKNKAPLNIKTYRHLKK